MEMIGWHTEFAGPLTIPKRSMCLWASDTRRLSRSCSGVHGGLTGTSGNLSPRSIKPIGMRSYEPQGKTRLPALQGLAWPSLCCDFCRKSS
jgi:hypothetical protein